ncbi:MAG: ApbE family lipoprotein [Chloroflexi bacterium]|jgi:thiamine biosynthesis lipoprotein|nr:ApbE family lipoprotein [Chloroflexota bacterium]
MEYLEFRAMNSDIVLAAEGEPESIALGFDQAQSLITSLEARLTRFSDASELAWLNRANGEWFRASDELFDVVLQAYEYVDETGGLFDPSVLDALESAGYDRSMDDLRVHGVTRRAAPIRHRAFDSGRVQFDPYTRAIRLPRGMRLDLGGIAKGWIAERAARELAACSGACAVSAGGDMFMVGLPAGEAVWRVALEDPRDPDQTLAILRIGPGAVATSSIMKRRWQQGKRVRHHLIDPRSGAPAETDWLSVTVIAPHATMAEVFAKALLIAGSRQAERIAARYSDLAFIAVDRVGQLCGSDNAKELLDVAAIEYA